VGVDYGILGQGGEGDSKVEGFGKRGVGGMNIISKGNSSSYITRNTG
jgi:hypothetical protein